VKKEVDLDILKASLGIPIKIYQRGYPKTDAKKGDEDNDEDNFKEEKIYQQGYPKTDVKRLRY
jgi:hypothetical protein